MLIRKNLTPEQEISAGIGRLCNAVSLAGAFISLWGFESDGTDTDAELLADAELYLKGWKHQIYIKEIYFWCEVCGKDNKDCNCKWIKIKC